MKKIFLIPNLVTAFSLICGLFVIFRMAMVEPGAMTFSLVQTSVILLLIAAIADVLDGAIARFIKAESEFGVQFDSLSDAVTFGVAPAVVIIKTVSPLPGEPLFFIIISACLIYSACGILRLVRYNVASHCVESDAELKKLHKKHFTGLPIPAGALALISLNFFLTSPNFELLIDVTSRTHTLILSGTALILGYLMVSRWKFPSIKSLHFRVRSSHLILGTVLIVLALIYGISHQFSLLLLIVVWSYIALACILSVVRSIAGRRSKLLEEFEPDPEEE